MYNINIAPSGGDQRQSEDISRYFNVNICQEEFRLMQEIDKIQDKINLKEWFELLRSTYKHKNIPKRVYLRATTLLNGYVWFDDSEYETRMASGKPVSKVTPREYALEKQLEVLKTNQ